MDALRAKLPELAGGVNGLRIQTADEFAYDDPVDGPDLRAKDCAFCLKAARGRFFDCQAPAPKEPRCASIWKN